MRPDRWRDFNLIRRSRNLSWARKARPYRHKMTNTMLKSTSTHQADFLVLNNVTKIYPTSSGPNVVIKDINLTVKQGEFICIIGHSGCGKSTLLNMVSGFATPNTGTVRMNDKPIAGPGPDRMVVFQNYSLMPWLTAYDNVYLALDAVCSPINRSPKKIILCKSI
jgi:ABC-type nitrate/sulfonate/bicarbonate transport system ATPase subunit